MASRSGKHDAAEKNQGASPTALVVSCTSPSTRCFVCTPENLGNTSNKIAKRKGSPVDVCQSEWKSIVDTTIAKNPFITHICNMLGRGKRGHLSNWNALRAATTVEQVVETSIRNRYPVE